MDWYVDNILGSDGNNGHSTGAAKATMDGVNAAVDFTSGNSPHNIYIRATGTHYTGNNNVQILWKVGVSGITLDRYVTDTGTSRPIFDKGATDNNGRCWAFTTSNNVIVRNIHFIGMASGGTDTNHYGTLGFNGAAASPTVEYCIFDQRFTEFSIKTTTNLTGTFTVRYCHFLRDVSIQDTLSNGAIHEVTAGGAENWSIVHNLFENYAQPIRLYYHHGMLAGTYTIDHNTFQNCGRTSSGTIAEFGTVATGDTFVFTNNIIIGNGSAGSKGLNYTKGGGTVSPDYNDWQGIATHYSVVSPPTPAHDLELDPEWQLGTSTWTEAYIALPVYYAPADTNYGVVLGDSGGACQGAIYVAPYVPPTPEPETPTPVTIDQPTIPGLGGLPCAGNELFKRLKLHLVDDNIYDTSDAAIGVTNYTASFSGNIGDMPVTSLTVYRTYRGETKVVAVLFPDSGGNYSFVDKLPRGRASYYAVSSDGLYSSSSIHVASYNIHVWLCAYAAELLLAKNETAMARQRAKVEDGTDFDGAAIETDGASLVSNFGQYISARRLESMSRAEYQQLLLNVLAAYNLGPSVEAFDLVCEVFTSRLPSLVWYKDVHGFPTVSPRFRVLSPPSLDYEWDASWFYLYDRWMCLPAGSGAVPAGSVRYLYVDGTTSPVACDNQLSLIASGTRPWRYEMDHSEVLDSSVIHVDSTGTNTGVSGELYVTVSRYPLSVEGASGSFAPYASGITSISLVNNLSNIDLGVAQDEIDKTLVFGNISVNYTTNYEFEILGVVGAGAAITGIGQCGRLDGMGAVARDVEVHHQCGELGIYGSQGLSDEARADLFNTLRDVKPAQKFFYVYMENETTGALEYYGRI